MKDWVYRFDPVTKAEWLKQMETDMKGTPLSMLLSDWWPGETLDPLIYPDEEKPDPVRLPDQLFVHPPMIVERIDVSGQPPDEINKRVHESLAFGAQSILFHALPLFFHPGWLKGVHLDMVSIQMEVGESTDQEIAELIQYLPSSVSLRIPVGVNNLQNPDYISPESRRRDDSQKRNQYVYSISSVDNWTSVVADVFNTLIADVDVFAKHGNSPLDFLSQVVFRMEASSDYMLHIIQCRVLHLVWQNVVSTIIKTGSTPLLQLENFISQKSEENPDHFLIRAAMSGLASSMGGTNRLLFLPTSDALGMYRRVTRNIHHLLEMESNMYRGKDPVAGSYVPDYYSRKWTTEIWQALRLKK